jgi:glycosyltransferase involved in cell wall biosynthesis
MKFSIVTISFNQATFLERTIRSVLDQGYKDLEYIVVDPGSTDGSREIIRRYAADLGAVVLEPDEGPADGLNRGFNLASGDVFGYVNSDDLLLPGALQGASDYLRAHTEVDVVSGDCKIIDADDRWLRNSYSDQFRLNRYAYGSSILIQPSTFFRSSAYARTRGFNPANRSAWDAELFVEMALSGARFATTRELWSAYRLHAQSITGSARLRERQLEYDRAQFRRIMGRDRTRLDRIPATLYRLAKYIENPRDLAQRLRRGPVYGRMRPSAAEAG